MNRMALASFSETPDDHFTPELLGPEIYYAPTFKGVEESDRWQESLALKQMAEHLYVCASS